MSFIRLLAADSKMFQRGDFSAPMGVCICFNDPTEFVNVYTKTMDKLFKKYGLPMTKSVYSASDLSRLFGKNRRDFIQFIEDFIISLVKEAKIKINVVYTTLSTVQLPDGVIIYQESRSPTKKIATPDILRLLSQYYPYISAWIVTKRASFKGMTIYLDNLQGDVTNAWNELIESHVVSIFPSGDLVCKEISAADLCVRYLDDILYVRKLSLRREDIESVFKAIDLEVITHYVGHEDLEDIIPIDKKPVLSEGLFVNPLVFILKEQIMAKEIEYLKARPELMHKIEEYAFSIKAGLKFIDYTQDYRFVRDGDHLITLGPRGMEQAEYLARLGYKIIIKPLSEL